MTTHLITIDLDGTLLNRQSQLSPFTIQTLHQLHEQGHIISLVTGRPFRTSQHIYRQLGIHRPMVNFNGALCHLPTDTRWQDGYRMTIPRQLALAIYDECLNAGVHLICLEGAQRLYASDNLPDSEFYPDTGQLPIPISVHTVDEDPIAVMVFAPVEKHQSLAALLRQKYPHDIAIRTWGGILPCLEIIATGINKATGVAHLSKLYQIPRERIIAFGDEDNDSDMIAYAGHGVAMANAIDTIKAIADDMTTHPHHEDGVAHYLNAYFN